MSGEEKKPDDGLEDNIWLFSRLALVLILGVATLLAAVVSSVAIGGIVSQNTDNNLYGMAAGLSYYTAAMAGREWAIVYLSTSLFSYEDLIKIDNLGNEDK